MERIPEVTIEANIEGTEKVTEGFRQMGTECQNMERKVTASTRQLVIGFSGVATSAFSLYDAYDRVQDMQVSVDRANLQVKTSLNAVEDAQRRYNAVVEKYGPASEEAQAAAKDLQLAQERYEVAAERAEMMQGNLNEAMVKSALQVIPTTITMVDNLSKIWENFPDMTGMLTKLSSKIGDVDFSAKSAALSAGAFIGAFMGGYSLITMLPGHLRGIAAALSAGIAAIVAATVAWMAFHGTMTVGVAVPIILAAVGFGVGAILAAISSGTSRAKAMAAGGIVTGPTFALIGEAEPEAVIPLSRISNVWSPKTSYVYVTVNEARTPRQTADTVIDALRRSGVI